MNDKEYILQLKNLSVSYSPDKYAVKNVSVSIKPQAITSIIGPVGAGKKTLLRAINRLHELYPNIKTTGEILLNEENIFTLNPILVRRRIGMVFQEPNPFPNMSIFDNVLAGYNLNKIRLSKEEKNIIGEKNLKAVNLWEDVKDNLHKYPSLLSKGQQQRLCIARTIALEPELLLMNEPTSILETASANKIEELMEQLKENYSIMVITKNLSQAARISDYTMFMEGGELIEYGITSKLFWNPQDKRTDRFIASQT